MPGCHTYEDTLLQMQRYAEEAGIPYRWWLLDSWWHAFDSNRFFEDTPEQVGALFPRGLRYLFNASNGMAVGVHWSSSFADDSPYINRTGQADWSCHAGSCIPHSERIWDYIFGSGESWGLQTIKVDHLYESLAAQPAVLDDPFLAHEFLGGIAQV